MSGQQRRIIPSEELTEFQRWQFNSLLDKPAPSQLVQETVFPEPQALVEEPAVELGEDVASEPAPSDEPVSVAEIAQAMPYPTAEEIEAIQQQAHEEGYQAGLVEGRAQAELELQQLQPLLAQITEMCRETEHALADSVLELALLVAKQMIGDELRQHPKQLLVPIRDALAAIPTASNPAKLFLSPDDLQLLQHDLRYELTEDVWRFIADEQLTTGSCRIETPNTQLEFSLASRWKKIVGVLGSRSDSDFSLEQYPGGVSDVALDSKVPESATSSVINHPAADDEPRT